MKINKKAVFAAAATVGLGLATYQTQAFGLLSNDNDLSDCDNISLKEIGAGKIVFDANICRYDSHGNIVVDPGNLFVTKETADIAPIENVIGYENAQIAKRILSDIETLENRFPASFHNVVKGMTCEKSIEIKGVDFDSGFTDVKVETRQQGFDGCIIETHTVYTDKNNEYYGLNTIQQDFGDAVTDQIKDLHEAAKAAASLQINPPKPLF